MADPRRNVGSDVLADIQGTFYRACHFFQLSLLSGATYYFCDRQITISWNGHTWNPETIQFSEIQTVNNGTNSTCNVIFMGMNHPVSGLFLLESADGDGHTLSIWECHLNDDYTIRNTPELLISGTTTTATRTKDGCSVKVCKEETVFDQQVPRQIFSQDLCQHVYKGGECQYAGAETFCDKTLATCQARGNQACYGGYPSILAPNAHYSIGSATGVASPCTYRGIKASGMLGIMKEAPQQ